jgi:hypothetical protein
VQSLEDKYQSTLHDEAKELEQLVSKGNIYLAKQEEYSKKIQEFGPLSSDAFERYLSATWSKFSIGTHHIFKCSALHWWLIDAVLDMPMRTVLKCDVCVWT